MNRTALWVLLAALILVGVAAYFLLVRVEPPSVPRVVEPETWPLTGEQAEAGEDVSVRALSVKIDNLPAARPQSGLGDADVVYELLAEGGITRFHAIFHSNAPDRVGPVRSARPPDIRLARQYRSVLLFSGANSVVENMIEDSGIDALTETTGGEALERSSERRAPHNLYADLGVLREVAEERGYDAEAPPPAFRFGEIQAEGVPAEEADAEFNSRNRVIWRWDDERGRYERELDGEPHGDDGSDTGYLAANVILLFAEVDEGRREGTTDILLDASGDAILYRDGQRYDARWTAGRTETPSLEDGEGALLPLAPGPTWIEVFPDSERDRFE